MESLETLKNFKFEEFSIWTNPKNSKILESRKILVKD